LAIGVVLASAGSKLGVGCSRFGAGVVGQIWLALAVGRVQIWGKTRWAQPKKVGAGVEAVAEVAVTDGGAEEVQATSDDEFIII
jgi:hypothetical protein